MSKFCTHNLYFVSVCAKKRVSVKIALVLRYWIILRGGTMAGEDVGRENLFLIKEAGDYLIAEKLATDTILSE